MLGSHVGSERRATALLVRGVIAAPRGERQPAPAHGLRISGPKVTERAPVAAHERELVGGRQERDLFRLLVAVSGVGPQLALALLGAHPPEELVRAIVQADLRKLCQAPGVGKRTA